MAKHKLTQKLIEAAVEANYTNFFVMFYQHNNYDWEIPGGYFVDDNIIVDGLSKDYSDIVVIHFKSFNLHVCLAGNIDSYQGSDWQYCCFLKPKEVNVTKYEKV